MLNMSQITAAVANILQPLPNYIIERNPLAPPESGKAAKARAWVGVYRGQVTYTPARIGGASKDADLEIILELQAVSLKSPAEAEDKLSLAEKEILETLSASRNLNNTVSFIKSYNVEYGLSKNGGAYFQTAVITLAAAAQVY